mmetsp:Transcript_56106/g.162479  ORF Transcript_56106/g.162479 Transcript_56106/m.162479 type:complete len:417 (-) Transcript_56106:304-1554(-)
MVMMPGGFNDLLGVRSKDPILHHLEDEALRVSLLSLLPIAEIAGLRHARGRLVDRLLLAHLQVSVQGLKKFCSVLLEVPTYGNADHLLACRPLDRFLDVLLHRLRALDQRQVQHPCSKVFVGQLLVVHVLEEALVADSDADIVHEAKHVDANQEACLHIHQLPLSLVAEGDDDAILPGVFGTVEAELKKLQVVDIGEHDPSNPDGERPNDDRHLKVEGEPELRPCDDLLGQVRAQWPKLSTVLVVLRHVQLRARALEQCVVERFLVHGRPPGEVHDPSQDHAGEDRNDAEDGRQHIEITILALAVAEDIPGAAYGARVGAIGGALTAALLQARPANAPLDVNDRLVRIRRHARRAARLHASEVAMNVVSEVLGKQRALGGAPRPFVAPRVHPHALPALQGVPELAALLHAGLVPWK